jgi:adenylate cyclase
MQMTVENRRLSAILMSDVVGYTRLMEKSETGTWARLKSLRTDLLQPCIDAHGGRLIKTTGDGLLAEFPSVAAAVGCARQVQGEIAEHERQELPERAITFRMGIDVGDVIVDEDDVYGETVNIAARLQTVSPPGGFCLSRRAYENLGDRHALAVEDIGDCAVRNLSRPVPALIWRPSLDQQRLGGVTPRWQSAVIEQDRDAVAPRRHGTQPLPPERSSVAILQFENMHEDAEQRYFADGLVEDVTAQLSRFRSLFVISRTSALAYRGTDRDVREIGKELGVEYVVEGSVRRAGDRIRVSARMIDVADGRHMWAEKYDRTIEDIFTVQDEITELVVATVAGRVEADRLSKGLREPTHNLQAYDLVLRGLALHRSGIESYQQMTDAADLFRQATELDPNYARAFAWRACSAARLWPKKRTPAEFKRHIDEAIEYCRRSLELDADDAEAHRVMGALFLMRRDYDQAEKHMERALAINPNHAFVSIKAGNFFCYAGRPERAELLIRRAMRLNPFHPDWYWYELGLCHFVDGRYDEAVEDFHKAEQAAPEFREAYRAACCAILGRDEAAAACRRDLMAVNPEFTIRWFMATQPFRDAAPADSLRDALTTVGFPA